MAVNVLDCIGWPCIICIGVPSGPVLISWLSSVLSNQQPLLGMGRILFHLFLVACWTSRKNSQARGSDHGEEQFGSNSCFLNLLDTYLITFGKPAGHREVAPREFDVHSRWKPAREQKRKEGEEEEE